MNYYYDVLINLQDKYCQFYEWDVTDSLMHVKKIIINHIDSTTYEEIYSNKIKVASSFLESIYNKAKLKDNTLIPYMAIFCDTKNAMVIEFNEYGESISKSSLLLEDEINICELTYNVGKKTLDYEIIAHEGEKIETKQIERIKRLILLEINKTYEEQNFSKLKFIFVEWFGYLEDDINQIINKMANRLEEEIGDAEYHIYDLIRLSYNNV